MSLGRFRRQWASVTSLRAVGEWHFAATLEITSLARQTEEIKRAEELKGTSVPRLVTEATRLDYRHPPGGAPRFRRARENEFDSSAIAAWLPFLSARRSLPFSFSLRSKLQSLTFDNDRSPISMFPEADSFARNEPSGEKVSEPSGEKESRARRESVQKGNEKRKKHQASMTPSPFRTIQPLRSTKAGSAVAGEGQQGEREERTKRLDVVQDLLGGRLADPLDLQEILFGDDASDAACGRANRLGSCVRVHNISKNCLANVRDARAHPFLCTTYARAA